MPAKSITNDELLALKKAKILRDLTRAQAQLAEIDSTVRDLQNALQLQVGSHENLTLYAMKQKAYGVRIQDMNMQRAELLIRVGIIETELKKCIAHEKV